MFVIVFVAVRCIMCVKSVLFNKKNATQIKSSSKKKKNKKCIQ